MKKSVFLLLLFTAFAFHSYSQEIYKNIAERISKVDYIFEGIVLKTSPYKTADEKAIYTSNVVQITKIFKGDISCGTIELITVGGDVDDMSVHGSHCLELNEGSQGIFLCTATTKELPANAVYAFTIPDKIEATYEWQSFIKYGQENGDWKAYDLWQKYEQIADLYNLTELATQITYTDCGEDGLVLQPSHPNVHQPQYRPDPMPRYNQHLSQNQIDLLSSRAAHALRPSNRSAGTLTYTLENQRVTGSFPKYLEFDIALSDNLSTGWFYQGLVDILYDTSVFGDSVVTYGRIQVTRGTVISSSADYLYPTPKDEGGGVVAIPFNADTGALNLYQLSGSPTIAAHVKIELSNCGGASSISMTNSPIVGFLSLFSSAPDSAAIQGYSAVDISSSFAVPSCTANILSFDTVVNGGIREILNIRGSQFGNYKGSGNLFFYDANNPVTGMSVALEDSDYIVWSDTLIKIYTPSLDTNSVTGKNEVIGTGKFRIETDGGDKDTSNTPLTVYYSLRNTRNPDKGKALSYLSNVSGSGGYKFYIDTAVYNNPGVMGVVKKSVQDWVCATGVNFAVFKDTFGLPHTNAADGINLITFGPRSPNVLATCISTTSICGSAAPYVDFSRDLDVIISDDTSLHFFTDTTGTLPVPYGQEDLYHVILHELGHGVGHSHVIDPTRTMHPFAPVVPVGGLPAANRVVRLRTDASAVDGGVDIVTRSSLATNVHGCATPMTSIVGAHCVTYSFIGTITELGTIALYPNPFESEITIQAEMQITNVSLAGIDGKKIADWGVNNETQTFIKLPSTLANGLYLITIETKKGTVTQKIVRQ